MNNQNQYQQPSESISDVIVIPKAIDVEQMIIGAILIEPEQLLEVADILTPEDFYDKRNSVIFEVMLYMSDNGKTIDLMTVLNHEKLKGNQYSLYIANCTNLINSAANIIIHAQIIKEKSILRKLQNASRSILSDIDSQIDTLDAISNAGKSIDDVINDIQRVTNRKSQDIKDIVGQSLDDAEKRCIQRQQGLSVGITTGITDLDNKLSGGLRGSQLIILAGRPAMGKSFCALHILKSAAITGVPSCFYSLEMGDTSISDRLILSECNSIESSDYRKGYINSEQWTEIEKAAGYIYKLPITIDDRATLSMRMIRASAMSLKRKGKCGLIVIDYLQLCDTTSREKGRNREQEISEASRQAKLMAKELDVPVILLSQLNRGVEARADKKPMLSDLRESGSIEQDADVVMLLHRPFVYGINEIQTSKGNISSDGVLIINIAKQRDGAVGDVICKHNQNMSKLFDYNTYIFNNDNIQSNANFEEQAF